MKTIGFTICMLCACAGFAQNSNMLLYGEAGAGGGTGGSVKLDLNAIFAGNNVASVGYYSYWHKAIDLPADYLTYPRLDISFASRFPRYSTNMATFMFGKMIFLPNVPQIRFSLKGGLAVGTVRSPENFTYSNGPSYHNSNYNYDVANKAVGGVILSPGAEFALTHGFGLRLATTAIFCNYTVTYNVEGSILFGKLRFGRAQYTHSERVQRMIDGHRRG